MSPDKRSAATVGYVPFIMYGAPNANSSMAQEETKGAKLLTVLSSFARYTPLEVVGSELARAKVIAIHSPYQGKNPTNPRYQVA